jgi:RimJ/RimL family protein N-acetyltransferase
MNEISFTHDYGGKSLLVRRAGIEDAHKIQELYYIVYRGSYPLSVVNNIEELSHALSSDDYIWMVMEADKQIIGSVVHDVDHQQRIGKSFGSVVLPEFRGNNITHVTMQHVQDVVLGKEKLCDLIYATTRTESAAPQKLTEKLGYKKLGIFPNAHKVINYETHCLTAVFAEHTCSVRKKPPLILPELKDLYEITRAEVGLERARIEDCVSDTPSEPCIPFEIVAAPNYVKQVFMRGLAGKTITMHFYPFHTPNLLLTSKDMQVQMFLYHSAEGNHCCIIGGYFGGYKLQTVLESVCVAATHIGIRYLELLMPAYDPSQLAEVLNARFLPSAYFPALQLITEDSEAALGKKGERLDYFVFSRSFEVLDFKNIKLEGIYKKYLKYYFRMWCNHYIEGAFEE